MNSLFNGTPGRRQKLLLLCTAAALFLPAAAAAGTGTVRCEPKSNVDAGRLNITVEADGYGLVPPCKGNLNLYIPVNTSLRSIEGMLRLSTPDGHNLITGEAFVDLMRTDYGLLAAEIGLGPASEITCRRLSVGFEVENCQGNNGAIIECPEIRVKAPQTFARLEVSGKNLNICHDD